MLHRVDAIKIVRPKYRTKDFRNRTCHIQIVAYPTAPCIEDRKSKNHETTNSKKSNASKMAMLRYFLNVAQDYFRDVPLLRRRCGSITGIPF
jgi:hypothetical protein